MNLYVRRQTNHPPIIFLSFDGVLIMMLFCRFLLLIKGVRLIIEIAMNDDDYNCEEYEAPYPPSGLYDLTLDPGNNAIVVILYNNDAGLYGFEPFHL